MIIAHMYTLLRNDVITAVANSLAAAIDIIQQTKISCSSENFFFRTYVTYENIIKRFV